MRKCTFQKILRQEKTINNKPYKAEKFVRNITNRCFLMCAFVGYIMLSCANIAIAEITPNSTMIHGLRNIILTPKDVRFSHNEMCYNHHLPHVHTNTGSNTLGFLEEGLSLRRLLHHLKPQTANVNAIYTSPLLGEGLYGGYSLLSLSDKNLNSVNAYNLKKSHFVEPQQWEDLTPLFASKIGISI
jgi:hypothetical protein